MESLPQRPPPARPIGEALRAWLQWFGLGRLVVTAVAVLGVGAGAFWLMRAPAQPVEDSLPYASSRATSTSTSTPTSAAVTVTAPTQPDATAATAMVVYVAGAVAHAGVYELPPASRVRDAVDAAGGLAPDADLDALNLAAVVVDGDRVFVPRIGQEVPVVVLPSGGAATSPGAGTTTPTGPINLNVATADELDDLPGIGPATAAAIVAHRDQFGPYASVDDLLDVRGIGPAKLDAIRNLVSL